MIKPSLIAAALMLSSCVDNATTSSGEIPVAVAPSAGPPDPASEPLRLRVGSYNVFYGNAERRGTDPTQWADAATVQVAASLKVDILGLQETNEAWQGALEAALTHLPHCRFHAPEKFLPGGLGTCSRYPILEDELIASPVGWFPAQRVLLDTPRGKVEVLNVHLKPPIASPDGWWEAQRTTRADRVTEVRTLLRELSPDASGIVLGDFNEVIEGDAFRTLAEAGLDNAFERSRTDATSWRWAGTEPPLAALLDHIAFERAAFTLHDVRVVPGGSSDHEAVVAELSL